MSVELFLVNILPVFLALTAFGQGLLMALAGWTKVVLAEVLLLAALGAGLWFYGENRPPSGAASDIPGIMEMLIGIYLGLSAVGAGLGLIFGLFLRRWRGKNG